ncbi:respiratory nitrate reductase subunit gamma [Bacillus sp. T33-2]|uniref:respiratory nitrate reductase subunit gamma n=1 Tax=Bacillus sp. T33-2 TaxID=2054168 RepID=UPI000C756233|nr:respiratory nitrate reductase subunit gamma [Bacillus sp. T33-2]PLR97641.1 hypothetical protein CVD19_09210 [Bacillus sp. T33-2]
MGMLQIFIWIIYPYTVAATVVMGLVWQYDPAKEFDEPDVITKARRILVNAVKALLILSTLTGMGMLLFGSIADEPVRILRWVLSLVQLKPDMELVSNISILSQAHFIIALSFLMGLAFTNKVSYLLKPHEYVKKLLIKIQYAKRA